MYELVVTDLAQEPQGPIRNARSIQFFRGLSKLATLSFQIPLEHTHEDRLASSEAYIKLYRDGELVFFGPVVTAEEKAEANARSLAVTASDAGWFLSKRIAGKAAGGTRWTTATDRSVIAKALIDAANTESETKVSTTAYTYTSGSAITYKAGPYGNLLSIVHELGNALDGYDWIIRPRENWVSGALSGTKIGDMQIATLIGANQENAVFEYGQGTRSNVLNYSKSLTRDQQANYVWHPGQDATNAISNGPDAASQTKWGRLEDAISGDFTDSAMRSDLVAAHVAVRKNPRVLVRMTPHIDPMGVEETVGHVPQPFVEYDVGDTITFRAVHAGVIKFAGLLRVFGIRVTLDQAGFERVELVLEEEA